MLLCLLSHKGKSTFISVYCMLHVLAFVENHRKWIEKYMMIFLIQRCRMNICFSQQPKHAKTKNWYVWLWLIIILRISQWDVIPKDTVPVVVYRWETWLIIFREERRLRIFENRLLRVISGAKREFWETGENCILGSFLTKYYYGDLIIWRWGGWISYEWRH